MSFGWWAEVGLRSISCQFLCNRFVVHFLTTIVTVLLDTCLSQCSQENSETCAEINQEWYCTLFIYAWKSIFPYLINKQIVITGYFICSPVLRSDYFVLRICLIINRCSYMYKLKAHPTLIHRRLFAHAHTSCALTCEARHRSCGIQEAVVELRRDSHLANNEQQIWRVSNFNLFSLLPYVAKVHGFSLVVTVSRGRVTLT